jgi:hypothetical protein
MDAPATSASIVATSSIIGAHTIALAGALRFIAFRLLHNWARLNRIGFVLLKSVIARRFENSEAGFTCHASSKSGSGDLDVAGLVRDYQERSALIWQVFLFAAMIRYSPKATIAL